MSIASSSRLQRRLCDIHLWLGMVFAPSLLFFAATGALQLFNLHEVRPDRAFQSPALLQELGMVHKDQVFALPRRRRPRVRRKPRPRRHRRLPRNPRRRRGAGKH